MYMLTLVKVMEKNKLIFIREFLFKTFLVSLLLTILLFVITINFWDFAKSIILSRFQLSETELGKLIVNSFIHLRLFIIFILLAPAISIHWIIKSRK